MKRGRMKRGRRRGRRKRRRRRGGGRRGGEGGGEGRGKHDRRKGGDTCHVHMQCNMTLQLSNVTGALSWCSKYKKKLIWG